MSTWLQGMRWELGAGCLEQPLLAAGLREEVPGDQGWGAQEGDQHGGDGHGPGERIGGEAARGRASGGTGRGRWPCTPSRLFGEGHLDSLPCGGEWSGRGCLSELQGPAGGGWGEGLRAWASDTPAVLHAGLPGPQRQHQLGAEKV